MKQLPFSIGTVVLGTGALVLMAFLFIGFLLPGTWTASRELVLQAAPEQIFPHLDSPTAWREWNALPDSGLTLGGPPRGTGARMSWDHPDWGSGSFEIVEARPYTEVRYVVEVEGGAMRTEGTLELTPQGGRTLVTWTETGDFGWNPLMGYWGLFMERAQGRELAKNLVRLGELVAVPGQEEAPADSVSTGA